MQLHQWAKHTNLVTFEPIVLLFKSLLNKSLSTVIVDQPLSSPAFANNSTPALPVSPSKKIINYRLEDTARYATRAYF